MRRVAVLLVLSLLALGAGCGSDESARPFPSAPANPPGQAPSASFKGVAYPYDSKDPR